MLVIFFLISFKKQASCKFINFAQVFVNVGSEMAYRLPLRLSLEKTQACSGILLKD